MYKREFLAELKAGLSGLPPEDIDERLTFYSEMIDDRMEEGLGEEDAVAQIGTVDQVISQIISEIPLPRLVRERVRPKRTFRAWEIALLILGSPVWFSLLIAAAAVLLSLYAVLWSLIVSLWAVETSLLAGSLVGVGMTVFLACGGNGLTGLAVLGTGLVCAGLSIFVFFGCGAATRAAVSTTRRIVMKTKALLTGTGALK